MRLIHLAVLGCVLLPSFAGADSVEEFIGITPTEFSEGFNRAAQLYRLKPRMPIWPAKIGKFSAVVAPGITVSGTGVSQGDGMALIRVQCRTEKLCNEAIAAAALSAGPELDLQALTDFISQRLSGELEEHAYLEQADLEYMLAADKAKKLLDFTVRLAQESERTHPPADMPVTE